MPAGTLPTGVAAPVVALKEKMPWLLTVRSAPEGVRAGALGATAGQPKGR